MPSMLTPPGPPPPLAPFGYCRICNRTVRLFRHEGQRGSANPWRCRTCGCAAIVSRGVLRGKRRRRAR